MADASSSCARRGHRCLVPRVFDPRWNSALLFPARSLPPGRNSNYLIQALFPQALSTPHPILWFVINCSSRSWLVVKRSKLIVQNKILFKGQPVLSHAESSGFSINSRQNITTMDKFCHSAATVSMCESEPKMIELVRAAQFRDTTLSYPKFEVKVLSNKV